MSKTLAIQISEELDKKIKMHLLSFKERKTLKSYIIDLIQNDLKNQESIKNEKQDDLEVNLKDSGQKDVGKKETEQKVDSEIQNSNIENIQKEEKTTIRKLDSIKNDTNTAISINTKEEIKANIKNTSKEKEEKNISDIIKNNTKKNSKKKIKSEEEEEEFE